LAPNYERDDMLVQNLERRQRRGERVDVELRVASRARHLPDVGKTLNAAPRNRPMNSGRLRLEWLMVKEGGFTLHPSQA